MILRKINIISTGCEISQITIVKNDDDDEIVFVQTVHISIF